MNRNPKNRHLKRIAAPKTWMLDKLSGVWAPRPSPGPHKLRECLPMIVLIRNRLKYALTAREVKMIVASRHIRVDGKVRTDTRYPCGFQDVVTINRTGEHFRLIYDVKGRFHLHRIPAKEATWKLLKVVKKALGPRAIPYIVTHDGRTLPYPDPAINVLDTIQYDFLTNTVQAIIPFKVGQSVMVTAGRNIGRVGILLDVELHPGSFDIVHIKDRRDKTFATRKDNIMIIGKGHKEAISLPKSRGVKYSVIEERETRLAKNENQPRFQNNRLEMTGGTVLPPRVAELRQASRDKRELLRMIDDNKPRKKGKKKKKKGN